MEEITGTLVEYIGLASEALVADTAPTDGVDSILLTGDIWGASGYYDGPTLARDYPKFTKGTRMFQGHPVDGVEEPSDKLFGVLGSDARYVASDPESTPPGKPTIRAKVKVFDDAKPWVKSRAQESVLGLSHRSVVRYATGTREGRAGRILAGIDEVLSVDFVTRPGAGGKLGLFTESAVRQATEQEGSEMPLSKEETDAIGASFAAAMKPQFDGITSALGEIKTIATESAKPSALTFSEINEKLTAAKLPAGATARLLAAVDGAKEGVTATFLEAEIKKEQEVWEESLKFAAAGLKDGTLTIDTGDGTGTDGKLVVTESAKPGVVTAWGSKKEVTK